MAAFRREGPLFVLWASAVTLFTAALFYGPARAASPDAWPAPLDDVYIHYDFARALAHGHPFEWIAGQGYSSGETSPAYAALLALGYLVGFRGERLGVWAALVACAAIVDVMRVLHRLVRARPGPRVPWWVAPLACPLLLACGTLDFAWFSGMEVALFGAVAARLVRAVDVARSAPAAARARAQWCAGLTGALLVLVRPESVVVVGVAMFLVGRRVGTSSPFAACARVALPGALVTLALAAQNFLMTGDAASAGASLKLLSSNPFASDEERARDYLVNLAYFVRAMRRDLGDGAGRVAYLLPVLAAVSLTAPRTRALGALCALGSVTFALLVSWNGAARYQNLRDYMPAVALMLFASALGLAALASRRSRAVAALGAAVALAGVGLGASHVAEAAGFYARACRNIHDQQVTVGRRIAAEAASDAIVLVGDAGAIPYESGRHAVDAMGLGGYHRVPFVRAAVHGEAATLELIERLPARERPTLLALYPNWFPGITGTFGHETARVTIADNVICGGVTKGIYEADWRTLRAPGDAPDESFDGAVLDELDVADVVSEGEHRYESPAPRGGWTLFDVRETGTGTARFDAGRIIPEGQEESFAVTAPARPYAVLVLRVDESPAEARVVVDSELAPPVTVPLELPALATKRRWGLARAVLPAGLRAGDRLHVQTIRGALHDFHAWVVGGKP